MMNSPVYFRELEKYSRHEMIQKLNLSDKLFEELKEYLVVESFLQLDFKNTFTFHFVGVIHYKECVMIILPKYMTFKAGKNMVFKVNQLMQTLFKYIKTTHSYHTTELDVFGFTKLESDCSYLVQADFIMQDFLNHGYYLPDNNSLETNGLGEIDWQATIELSGLILSGNTPIYPNIYSNTSIKDTQHIVHQIHQVILHDISLFFERYSVLNLFHYPIIQSDYSFEDLGEIEYLIHVISTEIQVVFSDQKLELLQMLKAYLEQKQQQLTQDELQIFGTKSFHVLWEKICSQVYGNHYEQFKKWIPKPRWKDFESGNIAEVATLIPDILLYKEKERAFYIIDAKYYTTKFEVIAEQTVIIKDNPSVGDVTKQYLYEQTLRKHNNEVLASTNYYNLFVFPVENNSHFFGHVTFDIFEKDFKGIYLYQQDASQLFSRYLNDLQLPTINFQLFINSF